MTRRDAGVTTQAGIVASKGYSTASRSKVQSFSGKARPWGGVLPSHADVPLGPTDSVVYLAGLDATEHDRFREPPPHRCTIPAGDYAVFDHHGPFEQVATTVDYIWAAWLPRSGLTKSSRPDFERSRIGGAPSGPTLELWISVDR